MTLEEKRELGEGIARATAAGYEEQIRAKDAEIAKLREENERLKALENKMGSWWALVEYEKLQARLAAAEAKVARAIKIAKQDIGMTDLGKWKYMLAELEYDPK